jgi:hypothetical protein
MGKNGGIGPVQRKKTEAAAIRDLQFNGGTPRVSLTKAGAYQKELRRLEVELVQSRGLKLVCIFEGRDAAGNGGAIAHLRMSQSACVPSRGAPHAYRKGEDAMILPTVCGAPAFRR